MVRTGRSVVTTGAATSSAFISGVIGFFGLVVYVSVGHGIFLEQLYLRLDCSCCVVNDVFMSSGSEDSTEDDPE
jgi:hypothetical protein